MKSGKLLIFSAPSGSGKTTIVKELLKDNFNLEFSISVCSREKRTNETNGKDYYFITVNEFKEKIANNELVEWEEVYEKQYYGTLRSELKRIWAKNKNVVFDIDVKGGLNIKKQYPDNSLAIFIMPPSVNELEKRLRNRSTDSEEQIIKRIRKAEHELSFANDFDIVVVNDNLELTIAEVKKHVSAFLK
ncbi:MAG: guanylate kinase [Chlorobi bacterium]|nr:guanylate kinase [Chlorobiota bacterium]